MLIFSEIEKEKAKQSERRKGKDEASVASEDLKCQHGTVTHIQSVVSSYKKHYKSLLTADY